MKELTTILATLPFGALLGIFVKHFLDTITNRPKPKFFQRQIYLERLKSINEAGIVSTKSVHIQFADQVKLTAYIIAINSGKTNTAFSNIDLKLTNKSTGSSFFPKFNFMVDDKKLPYVMNLEANTCKVLKITMTLERDEEDSMTEDFFIEEKDYKIELIFTDVKKKEKVLTLVTDASWTAIEGFYTKKRS